MRGRASTPSGRAGRSLISDLALASEQRWTAFCEAVLDGGVSAVFALPVIIAAKPIGALDLFMRRPGALDDAALTGALLAAELAALPLLDLMSARVDWDSAARGDQGWEKLASLERVEVYQATGVLMAALDVSAVEALARLRAHAYAEGMTAGEVAWAVVQRRLVLPADGPTAPPEQAWGDRS